MFFHRMSLPNKHMLLLRYKWPFREHNTKDDVYCKIPLNFNFYACNRELIMDVVNRYKRGMRAGYAAEPVILKKCLKFQV